MRASKLLPSVASPASEGRGGARVGGVEISHERDAEPLLPRLGVSNTGVNGKFFHPERLSPFPSIHLSFPSPSLSSLPSPLQVGPFIAAKGVWGALKLPQWGRARPPNAFCSIFSLSGCSFWQIFSCKLSLPPPPPSPEKNFSTNLR